MPEILPPGSSQLKCCITVCVTPVPHITQAGVQSHSAGILAVQPLVKWNILCSYDPHPDGAVQPNHPFLLVHIRVICIIQQGGLCMKTWDLGISEYYTNLLWQGHTGPQLDRYCCMLPMQVILFLL